MADRRIWRHPILSFERGRKVQFVFEGRIVEAYEGETIAAALYAIGIDVMTWSTRLGRPRGPFCMIGKCSSCLMTVNGVPNVRACVTPVRDGMVVERQRSLPPPPKASTTEGNVCSDERLDVDVLIVGGGPAGLAAADVLSSHSGLDILLVDSNPRLGGQLVKQTHKFFGSKDFFGGLRGYQIAEKYHEKLKGRKNLTIMLNSTVYGFFRGGLAGIVSSDNRRVTVKPRRVIVATGAMENYLLFPGNDLPGVMGAGAAQTLMNVFGVKPGERALVVGAGNVGLIVAYQLLQAGVKVEAIVEVMESIGGWLVHAAKVRRYGVPILTRHTVLEVWGRERVEGATIVRVDERFRPIPGSERKVECDLVLLSVGLTPDARLAAQAGALMRWIPEAGGPIPLRTRWLETSVRGLYVAGDTAGIEEATTAMVEGMIAGYSIALSLGVAGREAERERERLDEFLWREYRSSPMLERARRGKEKATVTEEEMERLRKLAPSPISFD